MPFGGVEKFSLRMTDFGSKNNVFDVKTLSGHNLAPFWLELRLYLLTQCGSVLSLGGAEKFWLGRTDLSLKTMFLTLKLC